MKWLPRRYDEPIQAELRAAKSSNSTYNQTFTNGTNSTSMAVVVAKKEPAGFLVHDPACDEHAEWSVLCLVLCNVVSCMFEREREREIMFFITLKNKVCHLDDLYL
jgi:hypothetical protein